MKVFITGATGFLGYHIATHCVQEGHEVICLRRKNSKSIFEPLIERQIKWVTEGEDAFLEDIRQAAPDVLVHAAWGGVSAEGRNNPEVQAANIAMTQQILKLCPYKQIIMLGSQDEYGIINDKVDENQPLCPLSEYAKAKIECCKLLEKHCNNTDITWQWVRIFSVYGEKQKSCWLIPSVINKCLNNEVFMETTPGEQLYSYLFATDFAKAIGSMIGKQGKSGIYNLSSAHPTSLKELFLLIKELTHSAIEFRGTLPYRENQSMVILGNSDKLIQSFGVFEHTSLKDGLQKLIQTTKQNSSI